MVMYFACVIRVIYSLFKMWAIRDGEAFVAGDDVAKSPDAANFNELKDSDFVKRWLAAFRGFGFGPKVNDYWLPFLIGAVELYVYPFLINAGKWEIIGYWLAAKTVAHWGKWEETRTPFNRFLFGNLMSLGVAYICLTPIVSSN